MKIAGFKVREGNTLIIAEIGGNHEGDFDTARRMVREAARAGANAVKFQILDADKIVNPKSTIQAYSGASHEKQWQRFKKMQFNLSQYQELRNLAKQENVIFLASVFDPETLEVVDSLLPAYKVASGDMTYTELLGIMKKRNKPMLVSTGAATWKEIEWLVRFVGRKNLLLMHCVCAYPAPHEEMNLLTIPKMMEKFNIPVGFSDHSLGIEACLSAVALGAVALEKHFTLDAAILVGDHKHSMTPEVLSKLVSSVRIIEKMRGAPRKNYFLCEKRARSLVRRSLYAAQDISAGIRLKKEHLLTLRPLDGIPAEKQNQVLGKKLKKSVKAGEAIKSPGSVGV